MSGGPALDEQGRVMGVNVATRRDGQQISFLVPAAFAEALVERARRAAPITAPVDAQLVGQLLAHQDAVVARFVSDGLREPDHGELRSAIRCSVGKPEPAGTCRRDVDDGPVALSNHDRQDCAIGKKDASQVCGDDLVPSGRGQLCYRMRYEPTSGRFPAGDSRAGDQRVDSSEPRNRAAGHLHHVVLGPNVQRQREGLSRFRPRDLGDDLVQTRPGSRHDGHKGTPAG
jgi:hypothetical protein